ncbi:unnamed protein product [Mesocestoides corti]|uniref:Protein kinase domain-containing protein n=2 Tax=Mesocestoides corti TaxID=53468 RepID=A0A0R3U2W6_MESCO|nr:unnamed protein product [Mesocestoides corti]
MPRVASKRAYNIAKPISTGLELSDQRSNVWIVGEAIGQGGFGRLYSASSKQHPQAKNFVIKIEPQENGPLFTETHFYTRVCKQDLLDEWKQRRGLSFLGIPRFVAKGLFRASDGQSCRFLVMDRFRGSLENCLAQHEFTPADIPRIAIQTVQALEYIHSRDYVHTDIKASNLLRGAKDEFYLADFGLVTQYKVGGKHKAEKVSHKLKDNGTLEFCSRDAHAGLPPSRRGDLEILVFNVVHWLYRSRPNAPQGPCSGLPWESFIADPSVRANVPPAVRDLVVKSKQEAMANPSSLAKAANVGAQPALESLISTVGSLDYTEEPDYDHIVALLTSLAKNLARGQRPKHVLSEVNQDTDKALPKSKRTPNTKKVTPKPETTVKKSSRARGNTTVEVCGTSHPTKTNAHQAVDRVGTAGLRRKLDLKELVSPSRRSPRVKAPVSYLDAFEPSDEEDIPIVKKTKSTRVTTKASQTSPDLLEIAKKRAMREERRKNFF